MGRTLVLGLGNPLMGDDGVGVAAVARLREEFELPDEVCLTDGGTWGMNLLPLIEAADELVLIDAIRIGAAPGAPVRVERDALPRYFAHKISPHQIDLREVLALAEWRGTLPRSLVALGVEPERVEMTTTLSPPVDRALDGLVERVATRLEAMGHRCRRREAGPACTN